MVDFEKLYTSQRGVDQILEELSEEDSEELLKALMDKRVQGTAIARLLRNELKYQISDRAVQRYRKDVLWR